jgi:hypothetical protein
MDTLFIDGRNCYCDPIPAPITFQPAPVFEPVPIEEQFFALPYEGFEPEPFIPSEPIAFIEPFSPIAAPPPAFEPVYQEPVSDFAFQIEQPPIDEQFFALPFVPEPEPVIEEQFFALPEPPMAPAPAPMPAGYVGCYTDTIDRDLSYRAPGVAHTIESCQSACVEAGYQYAGVQYGGECWCGDAYGRYGPAISCDRPCGANSNQICGGTWANSIYALPVAQAPGPVIEEQFFGLPWIPEPTPVVAPVFEPVPIFQPEPVFQQPISDSAFQIEQPSPVFLESGPFVEPAPEQFFFTLNQCMQMCP